MSAVPDHVRRMFVLLVGILGVYILIVGFGDKTLFEGLRVLLLSLVLIGALRVRRRAGRSTLAAAVLTGIAITGVLLTAALGATQVFNLIVSVEEAVLVAVTMVVLGRMIWERRQILESGTVLGVLCIYLLLGLLFGDLHQIGAAFDPQYLNGVDGRANSSDCLYLSVITLTTVGFGDVTPATNYGRSVAITEAIVGQLYLVSVVAAAVGGWRAAHQPPGRS